jgi:hypothetical protein
VRHINWLDLFPCEHEFDIDDEHDSIKFMFPVDPIEMAKGDARVTFRRVPDFQLDRLQQLNRFVELFCASDVTEPQITRFLAQPENEFIINMAFLCTTLFSQKECVWAKDSKKPIKPDFFGEQANGFSDIIEFKLPDFGEKIVTGQLNRESFSSKVRDYVSQTRVYEEYFEDPRNRDYVLTKHKITVRYPRRFLVVGRRWMFPNEDWKKIQNDYRNLTIVTYDDLVDGVRSQLYN